MDDQSAERMACSTNSCYVADAMDAGVQIAVCSTSNEKAVQTIVDVLLSEASGVMPVFAGDIVPAKKPDPAIYKLAAEQLDVEPHRYVACHCRPSYRHPDEAGLPQGAIDTSPSSSIAYQDRHTTCITLFKYVVGWTEPLGVYCPCAYASADVRN